MMATTMFKHKRPMHLKGKQSFTDPSSSAFFFYTGAGRILKETHKFYDSLDVLPPSSRRLEFRSDEREEEEKKHPWKIHTTATRSRSTVKYTKIFGHSNEL